MEKLAYVEVKAGEKFWTWLNDDTPATQDWLLEGIAKGADDFLASSPDASIVIGGAPQRLVEELRAKYGLPNDGSINWALLLHAINDDKGEEIGAEAVDAKLPSDDE